MSLPTLAEVEHADWPTLQRLCGTLGLNPKGRSSIVRMRVLDHVRRRVRPASWRPEVEQQAALLTRLGHPDTAARLWESTIQLDAPSPWIGLGRAQLGAGDLTEAAKSFERAAQMGDAAANLHRSEALAAAGQYEGAVRACDAYLTARPRELRGLLLKANFLARGGWASEAATVLRDAFEAHGDVRELWKGLGDLLLRAGRAEAAAEAFREALRASPDDTETWVNRGAALLLAGQTREAVGVLREVLERDPHQAAALNNLGVAYLREGHEKSAEVTLERAAKHMETPQVLRNVAIVQEAAHHRPAALGSYDRLLRMKPSDAEAVAARKRLRPPRRSPPPKAPPKRHARKGRVPARTRPRAKPRKRSPARSRRKPSLRRKVPARRASKKRRASRPRTAKRPPHRGR